MRRDKCGAAELTSTIEWLVGLITSGIIQNTGLRCGVLRGWRVAWVFWLILPCDFGCVERRWSGSNWWGCGVELVRIRRWVAIHFRDVYWRSVIVCWRIKRPGTWKTLNLLFSTESTWPPTQTSFIFKHIFSAWVDRPVMAFSRFSTLFRKFFEAFVQA